MWYERWTVIQNAPPTWPRALLLSMGALLIAFGLLILWRPMILVIMLASFVMAIGATLIGLALRGRRAVAQAGEFHVHVRPAPPQDGFIEG
ncbi:MAG: hypothetical protein HUU22_08605 [Phycisphaerae bacterium]|nr:hypothetical protein [Phycisphaerae bacterium]NUQ46080.1 hypothetical protein [Phycisphaerae bacterium]